MSLHVSSPRRAATCSGSCAESKRFRTLNTLADSLLTIILLDKLNSQSLATATIHTAELADLLAQSVASSLPEFLFNLARMAWLAECACSIESTTFTTWSLPTAELSDLLDIIIVETFLFLEMSINNLSTDASLCLCEGTSEAVADCQHVEK